MANRSFVQLSLDVAEDIGMPGGGRGPKIAGQAINEAIDAQNAVNWHFLSTIVNFSLTAGARTYALATSWPNFRTHERSDILSADGLSVEARMLYMRPDEFFEANFETNPQVGLPRFFTVDTYNDLIRVDRDPGATRTCRTLYRRYLPRLTGTATLGVIDSAENMIVMDAIWRAKRIARLDYAADKAESIACQRRLHATPQSTDIMSIGVWR